MIRMKKGISQFLTLLLASIALQAQEVSPPRGAQPAAVGSPEPELISLTDAWTNAILAKDTAKLDALMAPDFALYFWGDAALSVPKALWLENLLQRYKIAEYQHSAITARVYGDVGLVTSKYYWRGAFRDKPFEYHGYVVDIWRRSNERWQVASRTSVQIPGKEEPSASATPTKAP
jgi:hypothetical protein